MELACNRFRDIFATDARVHGAAGWQMNHHAYRLTQLLGFAYCSDTRGTALSCRPSGRDRGLPATSHHAPYARRVIGVDGITKDNVAEHLLELSQDPCPAVTSIRCTQSSRA